MQNIDPLEIANILATELWCQQLANLEGLQSGVPTRTTATITPTQLRNFEQTYIELSNCRSEPTHAGFVPPSVTHANNYGILNPVGYCDSGPTTALHVSPGPLSASGDSSSSPGLPAPKRRNMGGRRPTKAPQDLSPEEEERRKIRRERNKMAAARCRKRRLDHTNELQEETDKLEEKKRALEDELRRLSADREHLQSVLQHHLGSCRLRAPPTPPSPPSPPDVKPYLYDYRSEPADDVRVKVEAVEPVEPAHLTLHDDIFTTPMSDKKMMLSVANPAVVTQASGVTEGGVLETPPVRPTRPTFLQVPLHANPAQTHKLKVSGASETTVAGVEISTPSNGIPFNFDSLMDGGTGLTPVHPHPHPLPISLSLPLSRTSAPTDTLVSL
ncbi:unnamed protein product [Diatraea saccharalis]|uniref:BZIP domain-containing protein n=1 Tax=Diatraea saccharalis TaxID=40085 RepID=A0A9N9R3X8_9NEOP|nr:unnamed protein product [Diatraea saccharalis]